jgi:hypothetical protein
LIGREVRGRHGIVRAIHFATFTSRTTIIVKRIIEGVIIVLGQVGGVECCQSPKIGAGELVGVIGYQVSQFSNGKSQATIVWIGDVHATVATSNAVMKAQSNKFGAQVIVIVDKILNPVLGILDGLFWSSLKPFVFLEGSTMTRSDTITTSFLAFVG